MPRAPLDLAALVDGRPRVMGIVNVTPDSFSDGGAAGEGHEAIAWARRLVAEGADLLDVGGESTRPGAAEVPPDEQIRRVAPVIRALAGETNVPLSVDTRSAAVAAASIDAGATMVNDVSALAHDPEMAAVVAGAGVPVVLMHMRGTPATMAERATYDDVVETVRRELAERVEAAVAAGIDRERIVVDPGIGFAKTAEQSFAVLAGLPRLAALGRPLLVGASRKSFLAAAAGRIPPAERLVETAAAVTAAVLGGARIVRVHDVEAMVRATRVADAIRRAAAAKGPSVTGPKGG